MDKFVLAVILVAWGISTLEVFKQKNFWIYLIWIVFTVTLYLTIDISIQMRRLYE